MPANQNRSISRLKVGLTAVQEARLQAEASASGLTMSGYVVQALEDRWRSGLAPPLPSFDAAAPIAHVYADKRVKVPFTDPERAYLERVAKLHGMTLARFVRDMALAGCGAAAVPKVPRSKASSDLAAAMATLAWQVGKLGTNVNQMAHQANVGMVQVSRAEIEYLLNQHQLLLSKATAALEKVLA